MGQRGPLEPVAGDHDLEIGKLRLQLGGSLQQEADALAGEQLAAGEDHVAPVGLRPAAVLVRAEAPEISTVEDQSDMLRRRPGPQGVLPAVVGDGGESSRIFERPPQHRPDVPAGGKVVPLFPVHVHIAAMHRDDAGDLKLSGGDHGRTGRNGPVRVNDVRPLRSGLCHDRPPLGLEVPGHDHQALEPAEQPDLALSHTSVRQVGR